MKTLRDTVTQRILDAAKEEFLRSGYARASMRAIAREAGMAVGNIYLYFPGKEQLFDAVVEAPLSQLSALMRMPSASPESIRTLAEGLHEIFMRNRAAFLILISRSEGSKYGDYRAMIVQFCRARLLERSGGRGEGLYSALSEAIIAGLLDIYHRFRGDGDALTRDLYAYLNYMLQGLSAPQAEEACPCAPSQKP
jgi:AcrR family transcriptional regulator